MHGASKRSEGKGIANRVLHAGAGTIGGENMLVTPKRVGAENLSVDEAVGRMPGGDFGGPASGDVVNAQTVLDTRSETEFGWRLGDAEVEPGRRNSLQVLWAREKSEDLAQRPRQMLSAAQNVGAGH